MKVDFVTCGSTGMVLDVLNGYVKAQRRILSGNNVGVTEIPSLLRLSRDEPCNCVGSLT